MKKVPDIDFPLLIHIGEAKAGSTWLQTHLFNNKSVGFGEPFIRGTSSRRLMHRQLIRSAPFEFSAEDSRKFLHPIVKSVDSKEYFPVISQETITGTSRTGGFHSKVLADRLVDIFPGARILHVVREQKSMLLTQYNQYLRRGGVWSLSKFLNPRMSDVRHAPYFQWDRFQYHRIIAYYQHLFGSDNILVLPFEMIKCDPASFVKRIATFCHLDVIDSTISKLPFQRREKPSSSSLILNARRPFNFLFGEETSFNPRPIFPFRNSHRQFDRWSERIDRRLSKNIKRRHQRKAEAMISARVGSYFAESNQITSDITGINLADYGYDF